jgi:hypothetical protein
LTLDRDHLPHVTLMQLYVREDELDAAYERIGAVAGARAALRLQVTGGGKGSNAVWMTIERSAPLVELHETLMEALRGVERPGGGPAAFFGGDARVADVMWVAGYRLKSSFGHFTPHITLGHAPAPPPIEPFTFDASTVAACHLGRFCTCRSVLRSWTLAAQPRR